MCYVNEMCEIYAKRWGKIIEEKILVEPEVDYTWVGMSEIINRWWHVVKLEQAYEPICCEVWDLRLYLHKLISQFGYQSWGHRP